MKILMLTASFLLLLLASGIVNASPLKEESFNVSLIEPVFGELDFSHDAFTVSSSDGPDKDGTPPATTVLTICSEMTDSAKKAFKSKIGLAKNIKSNQVEIEARAIQRDGQISIYCAYDVIMKVKIQDDILLKH